MYELNQYSSSLFRIQSKLLFLKLKWCQTRNPSKISRGFNFPWMEDQYKFRGDKFSWICQKTAKSVKLIQAKINLEKINFR